MGKRKISQRQLLDSASTLMDEKTESLFDQPRFAAYIDGQRVNAIPKPFLVHVRGAEPPFDSNLTEYWDLQKKVRRVR